MHFFNNNRKKNRIINRTEIQSEHDSIEFQKEQLTEIFENGDVETITSDTAYLIGGEIIRSARDVSGQCQCCKNPTTRLSRRICFCGLIICTRCSEWWSDENEKRPVCLACFKVLKRKKFWSNFWKFLLGPFIEKRV